MPTEHDRYPQSFVQKHKILFLGIIVFGIGIGLFGTSINFLEKMRLCENYNGDHFMPTTVITVSCNVVGDVGQDLTLRIGFYPNGGSYPIQIPSHLEIKDPNGVTLYERDFDDKTIISFKPEMYGPYTATITSLEDENNRIHQGYTDIVYSLGFLTDYDDVNNPVGNMIILMSPIGNAVFLLGIGIIIYGGIKSVRKKSTAY